MAARFRISAHAHMQFIARCRTMSVTNLRKFATELYDEASIGENQERRYSKALHITFVIDTKKNVLITCIPGKNL